MAPIWNAARGRARWYRGLAVADGRSGELLLDHSIIVRDGRIEAICPDDEVPAEAAAIPGLDVVDASGATAVPGLVDCHTHLPLLGGARWLERVTDPTPRLLEVAERNASALLSSGVRWVRDVGSPTRSDSGDGLGRAVSLTVRDQWRGRADVPYIRAAGTWLTVKGMLTGMAIEAASADELLEAAMRQLDVGADLVKLYLDGPDLDTPPWSPDEVSRVVRAVHARGATVAAHATRAANVALAAEAAVDTVEHGTEIEEPVARTMAAAGVTLVTTLSVYRSFRTFSRTTTLPRFVDEGRARELYESALASAAAAQRAGVRIAAGSDCGGGSVRPGHLAWEVESLVEAGLEPWQALGAATWQGGEVLGEPSAGRLQAGGPADFVLVHGDPTTDASSLWRVWEVVCAAPA